MITGTFLGSGYHTESVEGPRGSYRLRVGYTEGNAVSIALERDREWVELGHARPEGEAWAIFDTNGSKVGDVPFRGRLTGYELDSASRLLGGPSRIAVISAY